MTEKAILLLSGPNIDKFGERDQDIYGSATFDDLVATARRAALDGGYRLDQFQSAAESELVASVHAALQQYSAIVINAGALSHYGWALSDALASFPGVVVELHMSNPDRREPWRHTSVISPVATACISGFKEFGYKAAIEGAISLIR